ncbi:hypothetical protein Esti_000189 [Eimeria stiedai]
MPAFATLVLSMSVTAAAVVQGVDVGVYYESRCPSCQDYVDQQILDLAKHAKDLQMAKVAIHPVPYGNTKEILKETGHYQYECQHGPEECYLNRVEACGLSLMNEMQIDVWAPWLSCVNRSQIDVASLLKAEEHILKAVAASQQAMKEAERARAAAAAAAEAARHGNLGPAAADAAAAAMAASNAAHSAAKASAEVKAASAAAATGGRNSWVTCEIMVPHGKMLMFEILACSLSPVGEKVQHMMAEQTPAHDHVPWVTVDHQHSAIAEKDLRCAICISPAGKERSLQQLCAGKEGCDKQHQQQQHQKEQRRSEEEVPQSIKRREEEAGTTARSVAAAALGFFHGASLDEV